MEDIIRSGEIAVDKDRTGWVTADIREAEVTDIRY